MMFVHLISVLLLLLISVLVLGWTGLCVRIFLWNKESRAKLRREPKEAFFWFLMLAVLWAFFFWFCQTMMVTITNRSIQPGVSKSAKIKEKKTEIKENVMVEPPESPDDPFSFMAKARKAKAEGRFKEAIVALNEAIGRHGPTDWLSKMYIRQCLEERAALHTKLGLHDKAVADWEEVMRTIDKDGIFKFGIMKASYERAVSLKNGGRWQESHQRI